MIFRNFMPNHIGWSLLALLRFVLAAVVAVAHIANFERTAVVSSIASLGAKAAVVGFLLVSGFSIAASLDRAAEGFYFRRFKRIYPVYFFAVAFGIILEWRLGTLHAPYSDFIPTGHVAAVGSLLMLQTFLVKSVAYNPLIWSLAVECAFYVIAPFIWKRSALMLAMCAVSIGFYLLPVGDHGLLYTIALKANAVKYFWPFGFGLLLYRHGNHAAYFAGMAAGSAVVWLSPINFERYAALTYAGSIFVIWLASRVDLRSNILDYLGDISYPLYLFQLPVFVVLYAYFSITDGAIFFIASLATSVAAYEIIDVRLKPKLFALRGRKLAVLPATARSKPQI